MGKAGSRSETGRYFPVTKERDRTQATTTCGKCSKKSSQRRTKIHSKPIANTPTLQRLGGERRHTWSPRTLSSLAVEADTGKVQ